MSIEIDHLSFSYGDHAVLHDICFSAEDGQISAVLGPNGVGKSTLFRSILGFLPPTEGSVRVNGLDMRSLDRREAAREVAYIPQSCTPPFNYTMLEIVMMGMTSQLGLFQTPGEEHKERALEAMETLGIAHLAHRGSGQVSGGERQLALLGRAIVQNARVLVMDEPTANLDCGNSCRVMEVVARLASQGYIVIFSTHDPNQAFRYADRVLALLGGKVLSAGRPAEALTGEVLSRLYGVKMAVCPVAIEGRTIPVSVTLGGER